MVAIPFLSFVFIFIFVYCIAFVCCIRRPPEMIIVRFEPEPSRRPWFNLGKELYNEECPVCWENINDLESQVDCKQCNHSFHKDCIVSQTMCPTCRRRGTVSRPNSLTNS